MNLKPELVEALKRINFVNATDVQEQVIPIALKGTDIVVRAKTGTGKTCAFLIPIIQNSSKASIAPEAIIIAPTRELALQIAEVAGKLEHNRDSVAIVYGGASINMQIQSLRRNPKIVVGTPGRIIDLIERRALKLNEIKFLVLDEADTMLDMGFIEDIEYIMSKTPSEKQTLLFSATMPDKIVSVAKKHMHDMKQLSIGGEEEVIVTKIKHYYALSENRLKFATLMGYIKQYQPKKAIIFVQTQYAANAIHDALRQQNVDSVLMHGGLTQAKREQSLKIFKRGAQFLIATNIAARGIDIAGVSDVINFDIPDDPHVYIHRVGRSARMNADGKAFSVVSRDQANIVRDIEYVGRIRMEKIAVDTRPFENIRLFERSGGSRFGSGSRDRGGGFDRHSRGGDRGGFRRGGGDRDRGDKRSGGGSSDHQQRRGSRRPFQRF